jgi:hypothetical protein
MRTPPLPACLAAALASLLTLGCERPPERADVVAALEMALVIAEQRPPPQAPPPDVQFADLTRGIALAPVPGFSARHEAAHQGRDGSLGWNALPGRERDRGTALFALVLEGSDDATGAEFRLGASRDAHAVVTCRQAPAVAGVVRGEDVRIDGQPFRHIHVAESSPQHYRTLDAYRSVRNGHCIAIDLIVTGTHGRRTAPPFDQATAQARLQQALGAVRIVR